MRGVSLFGQLEDKFVCLLAGASTPFKVCVRCDGDEGHKNSTSKGSIIADRPGGRVIFVAPCVYDERIDEIPIFVEDGIVACDGRSLHSQLGDLMSVCARGDGELRLGLLKGIFDVVCFVTGFRVVIQVTG